MIFDLVLSLQKELEELFSDQVYLHHKKGEKDSVELPPVIKAFSLPVKTKESPDSIYPFISICVAGGECDDEDVAEITFVCGVESPSLDDHDGHRDILQMVQRLGHKLRTVDVIGKKYSLETRKISWMLGKDKVGTQSEPYYAGFIKTTWNLPGVILIGDL
ncbi:MAG: hypothetical protein OCC45_08310 [Desulfotalea sp.]